MQVVAAAQHQRLRARVGSTRAFAEHSWDVLAHLAAAAREDLAEDPLFQERPHARAVALVLISTDRGMAGAFDQVILAEAERFLASLEVPALIMTMGKYGRDGLLRLGHEIHADLPLQVNVQVDDVSPLAQMLIDGYRDATYDRVHVTFTQFQGGARFRPVTRQLLPASPTDAKPRQYLYEPDPHTLLQELLPMILRFQLYQAVLESMAAETAARMVAMHTATRNADDLIDHLRTSYNKARQQAITDEMLDIIGASGAVTRAGGPQ